MNRLIPALAMALSVAVAVALPASADAAGGPRCGERARLLDYLGHRHGETSRGIAQIHGMEVELFASDETGTWTITLTGGDGRTCLVASGHGIAPADRRLVGDDV